MADKTQFLATVRAALGATDAAETAPAPPPHAPDDGDGSHGSQPDRRETLETLARMAEQQGWRYSVVASAEEAGQRVAAIAAEHGATRVVRTAHDILERCGVDGALADAGVTCVVQAAGADAGNAETRRDTASAADMGVTGVDAVIAETASVALVSRRGVSRQPSLLPPVHVAVATAGQVAADLAEALQRLRREGLIAAEGGGYLNLVSGPSRTADIEQTIVVGVHGPGVVHMVMIDDAGG